MVRLVRSISVSVRNAKPMPIRPSMRMFIPALILGLWAIFALDTVAFGQSSPRPPVFGGIVTLDGAAAPEGAEVTAWIDGAQVASATITNGTYAFVIAQPPGASYQGKRVTFLVNGVAAYQSSIWESDGGSELNLTAGPIGVTTGVIGSLVTTDIIGDLAVTDLSAATSIIADLGASTTRTQKATAVDIIGDLAISAVEAQKTAAVDIIGGLGVSGVAAQQTAAVDIIGDLAVSGVAAQRTAAVDIIGDLAVQAAVQ